MSTRILGVAVFLAVFCACEDNEHPFGDSWSTSCAIDNQPTIVAYFTDPSRIDDAGDRREYLGRVEVGGVDFPDVWLWNVEVHLRDQTAQTLALDRVPTPHAYLGAGGFEDLGLDVHTYAEAADTTSATMTGVCTYGDQQGALTMNQYDDCDLCASCDTGRVPAGAGAWVPLLGLLLVRRRAGADERRDTQRA